MAVSVLVPYARNARTHSPEQVAQIAASKREWGWTTPLLLDDKGGIIAGHEGGGISRSVSLN
jgi:ParB-like chromosome segregation protein Spo0J